MLIVLGTISRKSSTLVTIAATNSRTRTKQNDIKTHSISVRTPGPAQLLPIITNEHSILPPPSCPIVPTTPIASLLRRTDLPTPTSVATVALTSRTYHIQTGMNVVVISQRCTSSASATSRRSSSVPITSASILNIATQVQVGNGPICWNKHV